MTDQIREMRSALATAQKSADKQGKATKSEGQSSADVAPSKVVGAALGYGLLFLPFVFAWVVLQKGYSERVRKLSFGWMAVFVAAFAINAMGRSSQPQQFATTPISTTRPAPTADTASPAPSQVLESASPAAPSSPATAQNSTAISPEPPSVAPSPATPPKPRSRWSYSTDKDEMRGTTTRFARTKSINTARLAFPYGEERPTLLLRERESDGLNIMLSGEAQFVCSEYSRDYVSVKFDDGLVERYECSEPQSAASDTIFIQQESKFLTNLRNAKQVMIEVLYFNHGNEQFKFNVEGLEW